MGNNALFSKLFSTRLLFLGVMLGMSSQLQAQDPAGSIRLTTFEISEFYTGMSSTEAGDDDYTWLINYPELGTGNICRQRNFPGGPAWFSLTPIRFVGPGGYLPDQLVLSPTGYYPGITMEGWEDDGPAAQRCAWNTVDQGHCGPEENFTFRYYDYPPGVLNTVPYEFCGDRTDGFLLANFAVNLVFRYTVPIPFAPSGTSALICNNENVTLSHNTSLNPVHLIRSDLYKFESVWEYKKVGDAVWSSLGLRLNSFNSSSIEFSPLDFPNLKTITQNTVVEYRVKTRMTALAGPEAGGVFESDYVGGSNSMNLSPAPPTIISAVSSPSCPSSNNTGKITVEVTGLGEYIYVLRSGVNTNPCTPNPETGVDDCGSPSKRVFSNTFTISNVAKGKYTLMVTNKGGDTGVCPSFKIVDVGEIEVLTQNISSTPSSCFGATDAAVTLTATGGVANYGYTLSQGATTLTSTDGKFKDLLAGTYTGSITDGCGQLATQLISVGQPIKTEATVTSASPSCSDPTNGTLSVSVTQGSGRYTYQLLRNNVVEQELAASAATSWSLQNLAVGSYTLKIIDADHPLCEPFSQAIDLSPPTTLTLPSQNVSKQNSTCYGLNNGVVALINGEGGSTVQYTLTNQATQAVLTPSLDLKFSNLAPGNYQLTKKRNITGCLDQVDYPTLIEITEPQQLSITLTKKDIRCHGEDDGSISSTVIGATPTDRYQWELNQAGSWVTLPQTTSTLINLSAGTYRLKLIGSSVCEAQSDEVEIIDPAVFSISSVDVTDIKCLGELGRVVAIATGGLAPYTYHYTSTLGNTDVATESTDLSVGNYTLKITDAGGCEIIHPQTISISAPNALLSFTYTLSNFSGYNVPCQGARAGYIDIVAIGGNGGAYTGYQYSIDGINYQSDARIRNLKAGPYTIYVRDNRGCTISKQATLIEPASQIIVELISKTDVKCEGDLSGVISVKATGGSIPYSFLLNGTRPQNAGVFAGLTSGDYTITVLDANGCSADYATTINALAIPMIVALEKKDVSCFSLSDGVIKAVVTGGVAPLRYEWNDKNENVSIRENLSLGDYTLRVIDGEGCFQNGSAIIVQPAKLIPSSLTIPVCAGQLGGEIRMKAEGGTSPFQYALSDKNNYQNSGVFTNVASGSYTVYVKDFNNCEATYQTEVTVRNDKPEPDFIVASKENARDTLVVIEISVPKPDSIEWTFDPAIIILRNDEWSPEIKVAEAGVYLVSMKGYFGGCEYSKALTLTVGAYDPEKKPNLSLNERAIKQIDISPNPNDGTFNLAVELNFKQRVSISVFDVLGVVHFKSNWERVTSITPEIVLPSGTPAGIYVVQVVTDTEVQQNRIIINR
jgi:hypothetical protein